MPRVRPNLSITLPRNFIFHYTDGGPKTPENQESEEPRQPSPPPAYRVRRRTRPGLGFPNHSHQPVRTRQPQDVPIPTIEVPEPTVSSASLGRHSVPEPGPVQGLLAPLPSRSAAMNTPRTPLAQIFTTFQNPDKDRIDWNQMGEPNSGDSISRPGSACSMISDSSMSSYDSEDSLQSTGGSCTSPESDAPAPFKFPLGSKAEQRTDLEATPQTLPRNAHTKPTRRQNSINFTAEMDRHLWATYQLYLQDPTVTPFKSLPGAPPPLGVCNRVAREARRSWRGSKSLAGKGSEVLRDVTDEAHAVHSADSPETVRGAKSGSTTPTGHKYRSSICVWPRSESATRRRLRELCKQKPSLAPHYQRLLQSRNSTPFSQSSQSRSRPRLSSPFGGYQDQQSFNTRDLNFSLTTSTSATMQPSGPLAQLTRNEPNPQPQDDYFGRPSQDVESHSDGSSQFDLGSGGPEANSGIPRLGSPFAGELPPRAPFHHSHLRPSPPRTQSDGMTILGPHLRSPFELPEPFKLPEYTKLPEPFILPNPTKRRAQHELEDELSPGGSDMHRFENMDDLLGAYVEGSQRRVRSRGFSLGDISAVTRLSDMFTPPPGDDQMSSSQFIDTTSFEGNQAPPAAPEQTRRLGSPFSEFKSHTIGRSKFSRHKPSFSTFPRLSSPSLLAAPSIEERLKESKPDDPSQGRTEQRRS